MSSIIRNSEELYGGNHTDTAHVCDICGVNRSCRGKPFTSAADVWQHKRKRHPEACEERPVNGASVPAAAVRPPRKKSAKAVHLARRSPQVQFCPSCGCNLQAVHAALEFVNDAAGM